MTWFVFITLVLGQGRLTPKVSGKAPTHFASSLPSVVAIYDVQGCGRSFFIEHEQFYIQA